MKMTMIVYNVAIESEVMSVVEECGLHCYTKFPRIVGVGEKTDPRLDDHIWPGFNCALMIVSDDDSAKRLMGKIRELRDEKDGGVRAFLLDVSEVV